MIAAVNGRLAVVNVADRADVARAACYVQTLPWPWVLSPSVPVVSLS